VIGAALELVQREKGSPLPALALELDLLFGLPGTPAGVAAFS